MGLVTQLVDGLRTYWTGVSWLKKHPASFVLLCIPTLFGLLSVWLMFNGFWDHKEVLLGHILFDPGDSFLWLVLYKIVRFLALTLAFVACLLGGLLLSNIISAPIYDVVSARVEKELTGKVVEVSIWESLKLIPEELKKVFFILLVTILLMLIPVVNVFSIFVTAFLVGWDFYDYPMARRGWSFQRRRQIALSNIWAVMGLGLWMTIPFVQIFLYPFAVVGGTILNLEHLGRDKNLPQ